VKALRPRETASWVFAMLVWLPVVAAQGVDADLEQLRTEIVERLRDVVLVELEAIEREIETAVTKTSDGYAARLEARLGRLENELDEAIESQEAELYAVEERVDDVLEVWDSEAERERFEATFETLEDRFWAVTEELNQELYALEERGERQQAGFFGTRFRGGLARRVTRLASTRLAYLERLDDIAAGRLTDARRMQEAGGTLTPDARARLVDEAARLGVAARPTDTAVDAVREAAEHIRQQVIPAPRALDASLAGPRPSPDLVPRALPGRARPPQAGAGQPGELLPLGLRPEPPLSLLDLHPSPDRPPAAVFGTEKPHAQRSGEIREFVEHPELLLVGRIHGDT